MSDQPSTPALVCCDHGSVRRITLNRPKAHNSLTLAMAQALLAALDEAAQDPNVRAVLIDAQGPSFSAGGDVREMLAHRNALPQYVNAAMQNAHNPLILRIADFPLPIVNAVQGTAIGAGAGLALAADLTLAAESAQFVLPFVDKLAIVPDAGCSYFLPRALGRQRTMGHLLTGLPISGARAAELGLIWECVPDAELPARSLELAQQLASLSSSAIAQTRELIRGAGSRDLAAQLEAERTQQTARFATADFAEGLAALVEKRAPNFQ